MTRTAEDAERDYRVYRATVKTAMFDYVLTGMHPAFNTRNPYLDRMLHLMFEEEKQKLDNETKKERHHERQRTNCKKFI